MKRTKGYVILNSKHVKGQEVFVMFPYQKDFDGYGIVVPSDPGWSYCNLLRANFFSSKKAAQDFKQDQIWHLKYNDKMLFKQVKNWEIVKVEINRAE